MNVPVRLVGGESKWSAEDWALESCSMKDGVLLARTLFGDEKNVKVARVLNHTGTPCQLLEGDFVGDADPVYVIPTSANDQKPGGVSTVAARGDRGCSAPLPHVSHQRRQAMVVHDEAGDPYAHVQCLLKGLPADLTEGQRHMAKSVICSRASSFSKADFDIGRTDIIKHRINTGNNAPHFERLRRHPTTQLAVIDDQVQDMLRHDIIEPVASPWCSTVVMVRKKDGALRFCIDYRKVNDLIVKDKYPLPKIDMFFDMLNGSKYFSSCDLCQGYWQTVIAEEDRDKTAFVTRKGQWRFKVQSFGLCNAPSQFAYDICLIYLDDILVFSKTFEEHCAHLGAVIDRLDQYTLKLKPSKCSLFQRKVSFLGHVISEKGIECDPDKTSAISAWQRPATIPEVRTFCGLAFYYRTFVPHFADVARPLHELTRKNALFAWDDDCECAFRELKGRLTSPPILVAPRDDGEYVIDTDASDYALGAVLQQQQDGHLKVIGYASRSLTAPERRYCITRRELLGVVFGLRKFRQHLLGRRITVRRTRTVLTHCGHWWSAVRSQGRRERASELPWLFPARWTMLMSNSARKSSQRPCWPIGSGVLIRYVKAA